MRRQFDTVLLGSIELFCLAAEKSSFTLAANAAGVTPAAVSRAIGRLEARLNTRLFTRSTRQIHLTEAGSTYFHQCKITLRQFRDAEDEISGNAQSPSGTIRISIPTTFGHFRILPLLKEFLKAYPNISLDIHISNSNIDFLTDGFDLAIRGRVPPESNLVARKIEDAALVVIAAPEYIRHHGCPQSLDDLAKHNCIQFELPSTGRKIPWLFNHNNQAIEVTTNGRLCCAADVLGGLTLAKTGAGLFQTYRFIVNDDLKNGSLIEVLAQYSGRSRPFNLLYPQNRLLPYRVRIFIDFIFAKIHPINPLKSETSISILDPAHQDKGLELT